MFPVHIFKGLEWKVRTDEVNGKMVELRDDCGGGGGSFGDGNAKKKSKFAFDFNFQIEKYRYDSCKQRLGSLFDQVVVAFLREKSAGKGHRPIPALCGDGQPVDLFKLFWLVRKFGGYDAVSRNDSWGFISEECGLGCGVISSLKLVYMNYLSELDQSLKQVFSQSVLEEDHCGFFQNLDLLSHELEIRSKDSLSGKQKQEPLEKASKFVGEANGMDHIMTDDFSSSTKNAEAKIVNNVNELFSGKIDDGSEDGGDTIRSIKKHIDKITAKVINNGETTSVAAVENDDGNSSVNEKNGSCKSAKGIVKVISRQTNHAEIATDDEDILVAQPNIECMVTSKNDVGNVLVSRKRKLEPYDFAGMLGWLSHVAKCSNDPSVGTIPECSKWSEGYKEFWAEALFVREALLIKRQACKAAVDVLPKDQPKKPRMLPSMYEDEVVNHPTTEKLRYSRRLPLIKTHSCSCCIASATPHTKDISHQDAPPVLAATVVKEQPSNMNDHKPVERQVSIGPRFQAEVPEWTGIASDSDTKWLGTRMWPLEDDERKPVLRLDPLGKGRQNQCNCSFPGSVECVRFHVAEKRLKLKQEHGSLFYRWRFHLMGEEVSLSWTEEEEMLFKDNMKLHASSSKKFWNNSWRFLPSKSREKLISYYFNVYVVQRRSYQNRVTPKDVDSDDDEKECGSIGGRFGHKALYRPQSSSISCTLNTESTEFV